MCKFKIGLPDRMLDHPRRGKREWWRKLLAYCDEEGTPLLVAVRDNYLSVYVCGSAIFKKIAQTNGAIHATFDRRYFDGHKPCPNQGWRVRAARASEP